MVSFMPRPLHLQDRKYVFIEQEAGRAPEQVVTLSESTVPAVNFVFTWGLFPKLAVLYPKHAAEYFEHFTFQTRKCVMYFWEIHVRRRLSVNAIITEFLPIRTPTPYSFICYLKVNHHMGPRTSDIVCPCGRHRWPCRTIWVCQRIL